MSYYQKSSYRPTGDSYRPNNRPGDTSHNGQPPRNHRPDSFSQDSQYGGYNNRPNQASYNNGSSGNPRSNGPRGGVNNFRGLNQGSSYNPQSHSSSYHNTQNGPNGYRKNNGNANYGQGNYQSNYANNYQSNYNQPSNYGNNRYQKKPHTANHSVYSQAHTENQVWMGDLDPNWTEADINQIWTQLGEVPMNIKLLRDKMGKPTCCFVKFSTSASAANALKRNKTPIPGTAKIFKVNLPSGSSQANESHQGGPLNHGPKSSADYSIFVGDLPVDISEAILFEKFNSVYPGSVKQAKVMTDPNSGTSKGFGFVRFVSAEIQQRALKEMNGAIVNQRQIKVGQANGANQEVSIKKSGDLASSPVNLAQHQPALSPFTDPKNTVICVKHITYGITRDDLIAHFLSFGHIVYCKVNYNENVAHIKFLLRGAAERAILYMHGIPINGNRVVLRWGREESATGQKTRFQPVGKNSKYVAAEKLPPMYGFLPQNVVFEDLTAEQAKSLNFLDKDMTVESLNQFEQEQLEARDQILDSLF